MTVAWDCSQIIVGKMNCGGEGLFVLFALFTLLAMLWV